MKWFRKCNTVSCYSNKYKEIKMCDLEPISEIQSHILKGIILMVYLYVPAKYFSDKM